MAGTRIHRVTLVFRVESDLNQRQMRERLATLTQPGNPILDKLRQAIGGDTIDNKSHTVSNPPYKGW